MIKKSNNIILDIYGKSAGNILEKIVRGQVSVTRKFRDNIKSGLIHVIEGHIEEKQLFLNYLEEIYNEAIEEDDANSAENYKQIIGRFTSSFESDTPVSSNDILLFKKYFEEVLYKGQEFELTSKDASVSNLNWELITTYSSRFNNKNKNILLNKLRVLSSKVDKLTSEELGIIENSKNEEEVFSNLIELAIGDMELALNISKDIKLNTNSASGTISVGMELKSIKERKSSLVKLLGSKAKQLLLEYDKEAKILLENQLKDIDLVNTRMPVSFTNDIEKLLASAFLGEASKNKTIKASKQLKKKLTSDKASVRSRIKKHKNVKNESEKTIRKISAYKKSVPINFSPFRVMALINESLAEQIRQHMGKSTDPPILLRNQTGRFSESAKILTLTRSSTGILMGSYTYQRSPYDVFLPGGKLHTQKRDPRLYIENSIRDLALKILGTKFPGIQLGLK